MLVSLVAHHLHFTSARPSTQRTKGSKEHVQKLMNRKGFTLIELMIVVAIIGILAAIAIPNFIRYQLKSKTSEARTNIGGIKVNQESFRATEDGYGNPIAQPAAAGDTMKIPWTNTPCPSGCTRLTLGGCTEFSCIGFEPAGNVYYQYDSDSVGQMAGIANFCVSATADLDGDTMIGRFGFGTQNDPLVTTGIATLTCPEAAIGACLVGMMPAGEVSHCQPADF